MKRLHVLLVVLFLALAALGASSGDRFLNLYTAQTAAGAKTFTSTLTVNGGNSLAVVNAAGTVTVIESVGWSGNNWGFRLSPATAMFEYNFDTSTLAVTGTASMTGDLTVSGEDISLGTGTAPDISCANAATCTLTFSNTGAGVMDATLDGDLTVSGSDVSLGAGAATLNTTVSSGLGLYAASGANASGEYGFVGGTTAILDAAGDVDLTATPIGAWGEDLDGTPSYPWTFTAGGALTVTPLTLPSQASAPGLGTLSTLWVTQDGGNTTRTDAAGSAGAGSIIALAMGAGGTASGVNASQNTGGGGGSFTVTAGNGGGATNGTPNVGGGGGDITLRAGDGAATNGNGGVIRLDMGAESGSGTPGSLIVQYNGTEVATFTSAGNLSLDGDLTVSGEDISLGTGTAPDIYCTNGATCTLTLSNTGAGVMNATIDGTFAATGTIAGSNLSSTFTGSAAGSCSGANTGDEIPFAAWTASSNQAPAASAATSDTRNAHPVLDFDGTADEDAVFGSILSPNYSGGGLTVKIYWAATSAIAGNVVWIAAFERMLAGTLDIDADSFAAGQTATSTTNGTSGVITVTTIAFTDGAQIDSLAVGDSFRLKITRDANNAADTMDATDAELVRVTVQEP